MISRVHLDRHTAKLLLGKSLDEDRPPLKLRLYLRLPSNQRLRAHHLHLFQWLQRFFRPRPVPL